MKVVIDLDLHEAIQDFALRSPALTYQFKSQDTVEWELYFVQNGFVRDMGSSFALKFGMIKTGDAAIPPTLLAYQTAFTYSTDSDGNVYYSGLVNFNTAQMATAIGNTPQINGTAEIRWQDTLNEIIHSINISTVVYATILVETGVTPPNVSTGYPDASTIELLVHKDAPSGYAGLNSSSQLFGAQIPVDNVTIQILDGQIASSAILAETAVSFVTPAANATVNVTLVSSTGLVVGQYVRLPIAGYYIVESIPDGTHVVLQNNGDPFNVASGVTVPIDTPLLPAQAAAGGGTPGQNAFTLTTASFTVPAVGATVSVAMVTTSWLGGSGYYVFITGAGYYAVNSITDGTHAVLTNAGSPSNAPPGTVVSTNVQVAASGAPGATGASGAGLAAYDALTSAFTMPAVSGNVTITIGNTAWISANQIIYIATAGYFQVSAISSATQALVINLNYPGNATAGTVIASGSRVSPGGLQGPQGAGGAGLNAFTTLSASFTQPAISVIVTVNVGSTAWMAVGQQIFIQGGGYYTISSISDLTHAVVTNLGTSGNATPGSTVVGNGTQNVTPAGTPGTGQNAYTTITASFTQPAVNSNVTVTLASTTWMVQNQYVFINGGGTYQVVNINDATHAVLQNVGATGNVVSGTVVSSGSGVSPSGPAGPQGAQGIQGPAGGGLSDAPSDGTLYGRKNAAWSAVTGGGGGAFDPRGGYFAYQDFETNGPTSNFPYWSGQATVGTAAGIKWANANILSDSTHKAIGVVELQTGNATGNSGCFLCYGGTGINSTNGGIMLGPGIMDLASRMAIETSLPAAGTGYLCRFGLQIANTVTPPISPVNSVFLEYSPDNNSGNLRLAYNTASGGITYVNTSQALTADTFAWWELKIDTSGNITAYFNGVSIATAGPIAGLLWTQLAPFWYNFRNSGTAIIYVAIDTLYASMPYTR